MKNVWIVISGAHTGLEAAVTECFLGSTWPKSTTAPSLPAGTSRGRPAEAGIRQVCAIHRFLSANWGYISDPTIMRDDYYSPADRTIAPGFGGDCDDFAILVAACVAAVGGIPRIVVGDCGDVGHAWCEVLVGRDEASWETAEWVIRRFYRDRFMAVDGWVDPDGARWLSLDWRLGEYTCASENREIVYQGLPRD